MKQTTLNSFLIAMKSLTALEDYFNGDRFGY